jgi:predicted RNA binding protein YcfA (HicA-like mRNA interferase family)
LTSAELIKLIETDGWYLVRAKGSHHHFKHPENPWTITVPHPKKTLGIGLVREIKNKQGCCEIKLPARPTNISSIFFR